MSRVLMVDNAQLFRMLETSILRRTGWEIVRLNHGREIAVQARRLGPDLVLLDTRGLELDAPACVTSIKTDAQIGTVPIIVLTDGPTALRCEAAGADATLTHPVDPAALEAALATLGRASLRRGARRSARLSAKLRTPQGTLRGLIKDISPSGVFLALPDAVPLESQVELSLKLPAPEGPCVLQARGIVVRRVADEPGSHLIAGVGVRFTEVDATTESIIDRFVNLAILGPEGDETGSGREDMGDSSSAGWRADAADRHGGG